MRRTRYFALPLSLAVLAGCTKRDAVGPVIPANAIIYQIDRTLINYSYVDTTTPSNPYILHWLSDTLFAGTNCLGLVPRSAIDTTGSFVFTYAGLNVGLIQRTQGTTIDTVTGFFLPPIGVSEGTHGTFAVDQTGRLKLFWADGTPSRYFDPLATLTLHNDTITSDVTLKANGDSVQVHWQVSWVRDVACQ